MNRISPLATGLLLILVTREVDVAASECGRPDYVPSRIIGGENAESGQWPWQASLRRKLVHVCGGTVISERWVLSIAHCFALPIVLSEYSVRLGAYQLSIFSSNEVVLGLRRIIVYPTYSGMGSEGDIALLELSVLVTFTSNILPVCLPNSSTVFPSGMSSWVTGWGSNSSSKPLPEPKPLQQVELPLLDRQSCDEMYHIDTSVEPTDIIVKQDMFCAGDHAGGKDSCQGDSGGPLVCQLNSTWFLVGLVSWGIGCALPNRPGVYTNVSFYSDWIAGLIPYWTTDVPKTLSPTSRITMKNTTPSEEKISACGKSKVQSRIMGGQDAPEGAWPWQVSLRSDGKHFCGGSLISKKWVVSAAHCFEGPIVLSEYSVRLGAYQLSIFSSNEVVLGLRRIIVYPTYSGMGSEGDIALLELSVLVTFTSNILPVCLPNSSTVFPSGMSSWVTGWGSNSSSKPLPEPKPLQQVELPLLDRQSCDEMYHIDTSVEPTDIIVKQDMFCAGDHTGGKDSCQGDSGGPLVCQLNSTWFLVGLVSWGIGCALPNRPGVYTNVSFYSDWIAGLIPYWTTDVPKTLSPTSRITMKNTTPSEEKISVCGKSKVQSRIMGGQDAPEGAWPWQVSLRSDGKHFCGGSLISKKWVVSAAHCFEGKPLSLVSVYLGSYKLTQSNSQELSVKVKRVITNSNFTGPGSSGDISLLELAAEVNYTSYILPVCLPSSGVNFPTGMYCWVTGWGNIKYGVSLPDPQTLQQVEEPLIDAKICDSLYHIQAYTRENVRIIQDDMICAGYKYGGKDSCQGDSGGPLVCAQDGRWFLAGLVSFGYGCGEENRPGVYTRLAAYTQWIEENVPEAKDVVQDVIISSYVNGISYLETTPRSPTPYLNSNLNTTSRPSTENPSRTSSAPTQHQKSHTMAIWSATNLLVICVLILLVSNFSSSKMYEA